MALRSLLGRVKTSAHAHLKTKFLGPINNQNLLHGSFTSSSSSSLRRHMCSTPTQDLGTPDAALSYDSFPLEGYEDSDIAKGADTEDFLKRIAQFVVNEHNAQKNANLQFMNVVSGRWDRDNATAFICIKYDKIDRYDPEVEKDGGVKRLSYLRRVPTTDEEDEFVRIREATEASASPFWHQITLEAMDAGKPKIFEAVVWVEHLRNYMQLREFKPIGDVVGIVGIKQQDKNPTAGENLETCKSYLSKLNFGFETISKAAISNRMKRLAEFAVNKQNGKQKKHLQFMRVVGATRLMVSGRRYHITLEALEVGKLKKYLAVVWEQPWKNFMMLCKWEPIDE